MNELRTVLILIGILILAAIVVWSLRARIIKLLREAFAGILSIRSTQRAGHAARRKAPTKSARLARHDALARDFASRTDRVEEVLLGPDLTVVDESAETPPSAATVEDLAAPGERGEPILQAPEPIEPEPDPRDIDFGATVPGDEVLSRDQALGVYRQHEFELEKPHRIFGRCTVSEQWRDLDREPGTGTYRDIALTIQLADRDGPVSPSDLTRFSTLVLQMADGLGRRFQFSGTVEDAIEQAADLETLCREYDLLVVLNILSPEEALFTGTEIDRCARDFGLELGNLKIYQRSDPAQHGGGHLYAMANLQHPGFFDPSDLDSLTTQGVTLFMRLASTRRPADVFLDLAKTARGIAQCLGGELVDQNHRAIDDQSVDRIHGEIMLFADALKREGIVPGGKVAQRLF